MGQKCVVPYENYEGNNATFKHGEKSECVVFPHDNKEIKQCLMIAEQERWTFSVVSGGKNWGYGSATPTEPVTFLFDLSKMNKIIKVSNNDGYAIIQPGVTQEALLVYLKKHHPHLLLDLTAGPLTSSIIGNALERGYGAGIYGDHANSIYNLHVILPNQQHIVTGSARLLTAFQINELPGSCIGPSYEKIFLQGNFGIITQASISLLAKPESIKIYSLICSSDKSLGKVIEKMNQLKQQKVIQTPLLFNNAERMLLSEFKHSEIRSMSKTSFNNACKRLGIGCWNLTFLSLGDKAYTDAISHYLRPYLRALDQKSICCAGDNDDMPGYCKQILNLVNNNPPSDFNWSSHLHYDHNPLSNSGDPNIDGCRVVFVTCTAPFISKSFKTISEIIDSRCKEHQLIPLLQCFYFSDRLCHFHLRLHFDEHQHDTIIVPLVRHIQNDFLSQGYMVKRPSHIDRSCINLDNINRSSYLQFKQYCDPYNLLRHTRYVI